MMDAQNEVSKPTNGMGLSLSGGGYRATLFHLGTFWWFCEHQKLKTIDRISSVSGGSITSAMVGLKLDYIKDVQSYQKHVVQPVRKLTSMTIDRGSIIKGLVLPGSVARQISKKYAKILYGKKTLQDLPDNTRFVINATNVQTGKLWRFSKPYMGDYKVGRVNNPTITLADAVTASSAFPPVLSPFTLNVTPKNFDEDGDVRETELQKNIMLTDGGVYDNLGLEAIEKRFKTILVSDAGGTVAINAKPSKNWVGHTKRVMGIIHAQVASQRRRELIKSFEAGERDGTYWGIGTKITNYDLSDAFEAPIGYTRELSDLPTRLKRMDHILQERLINWGYAVCDAAMRSYVFPTVPRSNTLPYPNRGI